MNENEFVGLNNLSLGHAANNFINSPGTPEFTAEDKIVIKNNCLNFLRALCNKIKRRFNNLHNNYYDALECIDPVNAFSLVYYQENPNCFANLVQQFRGILQNEDDVNILLNSWDALIFIEDSFKVKIFLTFFSNRNFLRTALCIFIGWVAFERELKYILSRFF